jgi:ketosteroid isomerase-like protein
MRTNLAVALLVGCALAPAAAGASETRGIVVTRIHAGADGESHAEEMELDLSSQDAFTLSSRMAAATGAQFRRQAAGFFEDWHTAPRAQYVVTLSGRGEIEVSDGTKVAVGPGRILLVEDLTGKGHISRGIGREDRVSVLIPLAPHADAAASTALLKRQAEAWDDAIVRKDRSAIETNMSADFRGIDGSGAVTDKAAFVEGLVAPKLEIDPYGVDDFDVRLFGDVALLSGRTRMTGRYEGKPFASHYRYIDTYVRRDGRWRVASVQITPMPPDPPAAAER